MNDKNELDGFDVDVAKEIGKRLGVQVAFGSLRECVDSAVEGRIVRDDALWSGL